MCVITVCCFSPPGPGPKKLEIPAGVQRPSVPVANKLTPSGCSGAIAQQCNRGGDSRSACKLFKCI